MSDTLTSQNGRFRLCVQDDGNLVLYDQGRIPIWQSDTVQSAVPPPVIIPPPLPVTDKRIVRANFCNLTDSINRPIFSACFAAQTPTMQDEWLQREKDAGGTHYLIGIFSGYGDVYPESIHFYRDGRMAEWLAALDRITRLRVGATRHARSWQRLSR